MDPLSIMSFAANLIAIFGVPYAAYQAYKGRVELNKISEERKKEERRKNEQISIVLINFDPNYRIYLPNKIRRSVLTRGEIMGRLGMIPRKHDSSAPAAKQERFQIKYTTTEKFNEDIDTLYVSTKIELFVNCSTEEIEQFDIEGMKVLGFDVRGRE